MCPGNAEASANYVNGQLTALYENAVACSDKCQVELRPKDDNIVFGTCLRRFFSPAEHINRPTSVDDFPFFAKFNKPRLEFVCNHKVILRLRIEEGHCRPEGDSIYRFGAFELSYLIGYETQTLPLETRGSGGQDQYTSSVYFLDYLNAELIPETSKIAWKDGGTDGANRTECFHRHIKSRYFLTLKNARYHIFYSLPYANIDYSTINTHTPAVQDIQGVLVEEINNFLRDSWLQASFLASEKSLENHNQAKYYLYKIFLQMNQDRERMSLRFRPPTVQLLCTCEAVLYLNIESVTVGSDSDETKQLEGSCIAIVAKISYKETRYGEIKVALDGSHMQLSETRTKSDNLKNTIETSNIEQNVVTHITRCIKLSTKELVVFHHDPSVHPARSEVRRASICLGDTDRRRIEQIDLMKLDFISAITQHGINAHYSDLWKTAHDRYELAPDSAPEKICLSNYTYEIDNGNTVFFRTKFDPPQVQLRIDRRSAIFYVNMKDGILKQLDSQKPLNPSSPDITFRHGRLAFEMDLKLIDVSGGALAKSIQAGVRSYSAKTAYKQLILDFSSANLSLSLSKLDVNSESHSKYRAAYEALVYYVKNSYFGVLQSAKHHVLYIIPIPIHGVHQPECFNYKVVRFAHGVSGLPFEGIYSTHADLFARNSIVIAGIFGECKLENDCWFPADMNWVGRFGNEIPHGFVSLSHRIFLKDAILRKLEAYKPQTIIMPTIHGVDEQPCVWENNPMKVHDMFGWQLDETQVETLEPTWSSNDHSTFTLEGTSGNNRKYNINLNCLNKYVLCLPLIQERASRIKITGINELDVSYNEAASNLKLPSSEKSRHMASWEIEIVLDSTNEGLRFTATPNTSILPILDSKGSKQSDQSGIPKIDETTRWFRQQFSSRPDFAGLLRDLKESFESVCKDPFPSAYGLRAAYPVFNRKGDFFFVLKRE